MRDYDATLGRYIQAAPLGLVDGPSVYGYVGGNPARYIDPRGEFGIVGALVAGGVNAGAQLAINYYKYGNIETAFRCLDFKNVILSAGFGAIGASPIAIARMGLPSRAAGVWAVTTWTKSVTVPTPIRIGDECECTPTREMGDMPKFLLDLLGASHG